MFGLSFIIDVGVFLIYIDYDIVMCIRFCFFRCCGWWFGRLKFGKYLFMVMGMVNNGC